MTDRGRSKSIRFCDISTAFGVRCYALKIYEDIILVLDIEMKWDANEEENKTVSLEMNQFILLLKYTYWINVYENESNIIMKHTFVIHQPCVADQTKQ